MAILLAMKRTGGKLISLDIDPHETEVAKRLIEEAGLKGTRIGGAVVSDRHANFIVAEPECTSQDVLRLIDLIRGQVHDRLDEELELELEIW